jgi:hypothetical protein
VSAKSTIVAKARFRVMFRKVQDERGAWSDYFCHSLTYMCACEEIERLRCQNSRYIFKVMHEKLLGKEVR